MCCKQKASINITFNVFHSLFFSWERAQLGGWQGCSCYKLSKLRLDRLIKLFQRFFSKNTHYIR